MVEKMKEIKPEVKALLLRHRLLRDNDDALACTVWSRELGGTEVTEKMTVREFFRLLSEKKVTASGAISRTRRKIQEQEEETRGERWEARRKKAKEVTKEIGRL